MADALFFKVLYNTERFDFSVPQSAFDFFFQLYNFLSTAKSDNDGFLKPRERLAEAKDFVSQKKYPAMSTKQKGEESHDDSSRPRDPPAPGGAQDSFGDPQVQREIMRAGYTLTETSDYLKPLAPRSHNSRRCTR